MTSRTFGRCSEGAKGYVVKSAADAELVTAIRCVSRGEQYIEPSLAGEALSDLLEPPSESNEPKLTERERDVVYHVAHGHTNKETGVRMVISAKTVETYRRRIMVKLGLRTRADLVHYALEQGILKRS